MNAQTIIRKKRIGDSLSEEEISYFIQSYLNGDIPDYQMSALLMAVYFQGMNSKETAQLVTIMKNSGDSLDFSKIKAPKIDKHSTGGIGDKTTFLLGPILASLGVYYPTIAGRGLAHTGGTIDKFESIPGFSCFPTLERFQELVASVGVAFMGQSEKICPADKRIYALRDVTGTVESVPLIVASIMSKKLAEGVDAILFDVKCGSGAFMKTEKEAVTLSKALVSTAKASKKTASALVTDMSEPLGHAVGNAIEINECVAFLRRGPQDPRPHKNLETITIELAIELLNLAQIAKKAKPYTKTKAKSLIDDVIQSGQAYSKFLEIVSLQGGDTAAVDEGLPLAKYKAELFAKNNGYLQSMNAEQIGLALTELGGGRKKTSDSIDPAVGFWFHKFVGDKLTKGESIVTIYASDKKQASTAHEMIEQCLVIGKKPIKKKPLIRKKISK
ncbi:MAG: thymidine phosphorylase [Oligoflexia bacterium]|nr:thymidine phosphorylase [Oligoflexia bacterium]